MKKAIIALVVIVLSVAVFVTACSSPKSDFMSSFRNLIKNKQYTAEFTLQPTEISGFSVFDSLNPDALLASNLKVKTSGDSERDVTHHTFGLHIGGFPALDITAHALRNGNTGQIFMPTNDFFQTSVPVTYVLDAATNSVFSEVLADNQDMRDKHLDLLQVLQNVTNKVVDEKTANEQADQIRAVVEKTIILLYKQLNGLEKSNYRATDGKITLTLNEKQLAEFANAWLEEFYSNQDFLKIYADIADLTESEAKEKWHTMNKNAQETLKNLVQNDEAQLGVTMTLQPDADKGIKQLVMAVDYENKEMNQKLKFDFTVELLDFEKIPTTPSKEGVVTEKKV
ncbi:hypothetical protein [Listeria cornellensis]|uniref:Lipoprotein n=1 Tax=Listeria cornellensis FSL F6-0969 TaxID=1265820 RepID=W7BEI1_9LIST|nr:hypothetical protein [Listeria cornellensis]EUJ25539.1 lipoprotein [Listeria cornellensis FSL F6-0969]